jgi:hypothetical protein
VVVVVVVAVVVVLLRLLLIVGGTFVLALGALVCIMLRALTLV